MSVKGIERVKRNMKATVERFSGPVTHRAVHAILSQGGALSDQMTPMDTGTLVGSRYRPVIEQRQGKTTGTVGYTAHYAGAVHDAPGKLKGLPRPGGRGNYWSPNAEPGFLEKGFTQLRPIIPRMLKEFYRV